MKCWCCDYVGDNKDCWAISEVTVVVKMVVDEQGDKVGKVVTKEWTKAKSAEMDFLFQLQR